jgi:uncharacterized damage-inducible protein DinB
MITPAWVRMMARYNEGMNRRIYAAAGQLDEAARTLDRGAFWGSIHATLNHLLWADLLWMSRFSGWERPAYGMKAGLAMHATLSTLADARAATDAKLLAWAETLDAAWLEGDLTWFSGVAQRDMRQPKALLVTHMFNHQTHHRGQVHAMLTEAGAWPADTDLFLVVEG